MPAVRDAGHNNPTVKAFPAVRPEGSSTGAGATTPVGTPAASHDAEDGAAGLSRRELTLVLMKLCEEVERLGGDVSEVRRLLGMSK